MTNDDLALAHLRELCAVDALAPFRIVRGLAPVIRSDGLGRIVVVASVLGKMGVAGFAAYCAAKAAAIGLVRALALDLAPRRITVNAVCPGFTNTPMIQKLIHEGKTLELANHIAEGAHAGMQTFNMSLLNLYKSGRIKLQDALAFSSSPDEFRLMAEGISSGASSTREFARVAGN